MGQSNTGQLEILLVAPRAGYLSRASVKLRSRREETDFVETATQQEQYVLQWRTMTAPFTAAKLAQHSSWARSSRSAETDMRKTRDTSAVWCTIWVLLLTGAIRVPEGSCAEPAATLKAHGLHYELQEIKEPRVNRIHVLRVDLQAGKIKPVVVVGADPDGDGPAETALTSPLKLAAGPAVVAFINTNPWDSFPNEQGRRNRRWFAGQPVDISGLASSSGTIRSPTQSHAASVWFDGTGRLRLGVAPGADQEPAEEERLTEGVAGFGLVMKAGKLVVGEGGAVHPRTAIGVDRTGKTAWLVVVDGRQRGFSEGMNLHELGRQMKQLGCWDAMNMDGGGSSVMGLVNEAGKMEVFNSPSDRRRGRRSVRPLPMVLTLRKVGGEKPAPTDRSSVKPE